ncbi:MAG TPA: hypothetical protein VF799_11170 [Geobacteraceae bacterium]
MILMKAGPVPYRSVIAALYVFTLAALLLVAPAGRAQEAKPGDTGAILLTIFLKHDQSRTLDEIQAQLRRNGFYESFPPQGVEIVSWYVMMGIGQVVTLRVPPDRLRAVNLAIERSAWGAFRTEFYPTYDFRPIWEKELKKGH